MNGETMSTLEILLDSLLVFSLFSSIMLSA